MSPRICRSVAAVVGLFISAGIAHSQTYIERNTDVVGRTPAGEYRGIPAMQDNESSCAINPLLIRNLVCAWNGSGGSDDLIGDTWIRISESVTAGESFENRYMNGSALDPATSIGQEFAADPITLCWPGGCGIVALASKRAPGGGTGGGGAGIYMQRMPDMNREVGFRHALATNLTPVYLSESGLFADKPYAIYMIDEDNPGTVPVSIVVDKPGGGTELVEREWPRARIVVAFALGDPQGDEIRILSTYSDDYGSTWSQPLEIGSRGYWIDSVRVPNKCKKRPGNDECKRFLPQGLNQGVNLSAIGDRLLYVFRVFEDDDNPSAIRGRMSFDGGETINEAFDIVSPFCAYDVPTLPNDGLNSTAAARSSATPWTSHNGTQRVLVYAERKPSPDGGCFTSTEAPTDSRIKAIVGSADGSSWGDPVEIAPNPGHGFQFQPVVECSRGDCLATWWDSRFDTERVVNYLTNVSTNPKAGDALQAFLNLPVLGDFNFLTDPETGRVIQFRRTAKLLATKLDIDGVSAVALDTPPAAVSRYRRALSGGVVRETQADGWNIKGYRTSQVPFMGDYSWLTAVLLRPVADGDSSATGTTWESNRSADINDLDRDPFFWVSFITSRNVVGQIYTAQIDDAVPYTRTPDSDASARRDRKGRRSHDFVDRLDDQGKTRHANAVDDFNPGAGFCAPTGNPGPGEVFISPNNRTKDFDIYGAVIEDRVSAYSLNPTKTFNILRAFTLVMENETLQPKTLRLSIRSQPNGAPLTARASFEQLPFDPADPDFSTTPPAIEELVDIDPMSSASRPVFIVSTEVENPVDIDVYELAAVGGERFIETITVNGIVEAGEFLNEDGTVNAFERHNPLVFFPDEFAPDVYSPDEFAASQFNPDEFAPDEFAPDEFAPDEFAPDEFAPDEFAPDEFAPDEFASPLIDETNLDNPEIPKPDLGSIEGLVVKKDINYGIQNVGNTITPYTMDFAVEDEEVLALIEAGQIVVQLIVWQDKKIDDVQFCEPRIVSENRILAATTDIDLTTLAIPDIANNSVGALTLTIAPKDVAQATLRFIAKRTVMLPVADRITAANISSVFASQAANTGDDELIRAETLILDDRAPPDFIGFGPIDSTEFEADGPDGVLLPADFVTAERGGESVPVVCQPALPLQVGLDLLNTPPGPTAINCSATTDNGVTASLDLSVFVLDTTPPTIDATTVPDDLTLEATPGGTAISYVLPAASDVRGVDPDVDVSCSPAPDSLLPFDPSAPATVVECRATDFSMNESEVETFTVTLQDTSPPIIEDLNPPQLTPDLPRFVLGDDDGTFQIAWGPFRVLDAESSPTVDCEPGSLVPGQSDPANGVYVFRHDFPVDRTDVACTATDSQNRVATAAFDVTVFDETAPDITLIGDAEITIALGDTYEDPGVTVTDNSTADDDIVVEIDTNGVDSNALGRYEVAISATDASGNTARATRAVIVGYAGGTGIRPTKTVMNRGSSNALFWGWTDRFGNLVDASGDGQTLRIRRDNCDGPVVLQMASDSGQSDFRFKADYEIQFNWQSEKSLRKGRYCAEAESGSTGQRQNSPLIEVN